MKFEVSFITARPITDIFSDDWGNFVPKHRVLLTVGYADDVGESFYRKEKGGIIKEQTPTKINQKMIKSLPNPNVFKRV